MVEVAKCDDLFVLASGYIVLADAADTDAGDSEFLT